MQLKVEAAASLKSKGKKKPEKRREISFLEYKPHAKKHFGTATNSNRPQNPSRPRPVPRPVQDKTRGLPPLSAPPAGKGPQCTQAVRDYVASLHMLRINLAVQQAVADRQLQALSQCFGPDVIRPPFPIAAGVPTLQQQQMTSQLPPLRAKPVPTRPPSADLQKNSAVFDLANVAMATPPPSYMIPHGEDTILQDTPTNSTMQSFGARMTPPMGPLDMASPTNHANIPSFDTMTVPLGEISLVGLTGDDNFDFFNMSIPELDTPVAGGSSGDETETMELESGCLQDHLGDYDSTMSPLPAGTELGSDATATLSVLAQQQQQHTPPTAFSHILFPSLGGSLGSFTGESTPIALDRSFSMASTATSSTTGPDSPAYFDMLPMGGWNLMLADGLIA